MYYYQSLFGRYSELDPARMEPLFIGQLPPNKRLLKLKLKLKLKFIMPTCRESGCIFLITIAI